MKTMCIIGAGSIGALKDNKYDSRKTKNILTQGHAAWKHEGIKLLGICDTDLGKANEAARKWNAIAYTKTATMLYELRPDIVSICTPTDTHSKFLKLLLEFESWKPKLVICEKPFCSDYNQAKAVVTLYKHAGIPLLIDYIRRFDNTIINFKKNIEDKKIYSCRIIYGRGLRRDGCHGIDICNYLFGANMEWINPFHHSGPEDGEPGDYSTPFYGAWRHCLQVIFTPVDSEHYSVFEIDVLTEDGRYQFINSGLQMVCYGKDDSVYGDYSCLSPVPEYSQTELNTALLGLMDNAVQHLKQGEPLLCTGDDALNVWRLIA